VDRVYFDFEVTDCEPLLDTGGRYFEQVEVDTSIEGKFHLQLGEVQETFDETALLMVSTDLIGVTWHIMTFRSLVSPGRVIIPDYDPHIEIVLSNENSFLISLMMRSAVIAQSTCGLLSFTRRIGDFQEALLRVFFKENPHFLENMSFLGAYPGATALAHELRENST